MHRLIRAALIQALWPWPTIGLLLWIGAGGLIIQHHGDYLAWASGAPILLLFRFAGLAEQRRRSGWLLEERLRNPNAWRLPLAEFCAAILACALFLIISCAPAIFSKLSNSPTYANSPSALHPLIVAQKDNHCLLKHLGGSLPSNSQLSLLIEWDYLTDDDHGFTPGEKFVRKLTAEELKLGQALLELPSGARVNAEFARVAVPVPAFNNYFLLLFLQWVLFISIFGLNLLFVRLKIRAFLASLASLSIASLGLWELPVVLPDLSGLYAVGLIFELRVGQSSSLDILQWLIFGMFALAASTRCRSWEAE